MASLADKVLGNLHFSLEQVQDLTPTPMTLSSTMFYMGENPYTGEKIYVARSQDDKRKQKSYFFGGQLPEAKPRAEGAISISFTLSESVPAHLAAPLPKITNSSAAAISSAKLCSSIIFASTSP